MDLTKEAMGNLVNYEVVSALRPLDPALIEKGTIPEFIHCPRYERAKAGIESAVERHNKAAEEARDKLAELNTEALAEIDSDIVIFLERCLDTAVRLAESQRPQDLLAALETCFLALKTHHAFEHHMDSNIPQQQARQQTVKIGQLLAGLCGNQDLRTALEDMLRRNAILIEANADLCSQVTEAVGNVNQDDMEAVARSFQGAFSENFRAQYSYSGMLGPAKLETTVRQMRQTIAAINHNISRTRELFESSETLAKAALAAYQTSRILLSAMKTKVAELGDGRLHPEHFIRELVDQAVIEKLFSREIRAAAAGLRDYLAQAIGEQKLNTLLRENHDAYSVAAAEAAIQQANLLRLQISRDQVEEHINKLSAIVQELKNHVHQAEQAPAQKAAGFRSLTAMQCSSLGPAGQWRVW